MHELNKPYSKYCLSKKDYDIYHQMHFDPYGLKYIGNKPMVTTFHDINFLTLNPKPKVVEWQKISLHRADKIIAISHNTKNDIIKYFDIDPNKIEVIYHGIDKSIRPSASSIYDFPYILYVGTREKHKNFDKFIQAFSIFSKYYPEIKLVCTWKDFTPIELEKFNKLGILNNIYHFSASESQMVRLYKDALFFVVEPVSVPGFVVEPVSVPGSVVPGSLVNSML